MSGGSGNYDAYRHFIPPQAYPPNPQAPTPVAKPIKARKRIVYWLGYAIGYLRKQFARGLRDGRGT